jgi:flagellin-like protein
MNKKRVSVIQNKKGLSAIITTLLVVLLVLVAVGIVWAVVSNLIRGGAEDVELASKCLNVDVRATAVNCASASSCVVTLERSGSNNDAIAGVKMVFRDATNSLSSAVIDEAGNIENLVGKSVTDVDSGVTAPDKIEVTVYFEDASGNDKLCTQTNPFSF